MTSLFIYIFQLIPLQQQKSIYPTMQYQNINLSQIMDTWIGQNVILIPKGFKMITVFENRQLPIKKFENICHQGALFSDLARNNCLLERDNYMKPNFYQSEHQFVVKAMPRYSHHRVSLANLGEMYNCTKAESGRVARKRRASQHEPIPNRYDHIYPMKQNNQQTQNTDGWFSKNCLSPQSPRYQFKQLLHKDNTHNLPPSPSYLNPKTKPHSTESMKQIVLQINQIKLPQQDRLSPQYQQANKKFQTMKSQILQKIIKQGQGNQLQNILKQIRIAADQIISRHKISQEEHHGQYVSNRNTFSFTDQFLEDNAKLDIDKVQSIEEKKIQCSDNLPKFKDDTSSISSILSTNGIKKYQLDSKDQDQCKNDHVVVNDAHHFINNKEEDISNSSQRGTKEKIANAFQYKNLNVQEQKFPATNKSNKVDQIQVITPTKYIIQTQNNNIKPKNDNSMIHNQIPPQPQPTDIPFQYQLQRLTDQPVKIITNLQQAKMFDPQVVKYTQLKLKYIQTRTIGAEIVRIPSPLRFKKKQEGGKNVLGGNCFGGKQSGRKQF